jgi:hypothetical protein
LSDVVPNLVAASTFYVPGGESRFRATDATVGPWSSDLQHGSPPAALLGRAIERSLPRADARVGRIAFDFLGPVAVGDVSLEVAVERAGTRIELARAHLSIDGRVAMQARAWRLATYEGRVPAVPPAPMAIPPLPPAQHIPAFQGLARFGYAEALEWRFVEGAFDTLGPAMAWTRPRIPLVEGETPSPLERLLLMVDSANGISAELDPRRYTFVPVELTVALHRYPRTEWIGMRARTAIDGDGIGLVRADLFDEEGPIGTALQTLFVAPR